MANTMTNILPKILARGLRVLRKQSTMPRIVNASYNMDAKRKGATIDIPIPVTYTVEDVTAGPVPASSQDSQPDLVQITLNQWKQVPFFLTDNELMQIDKNSHFLPMNMESAVEALAVKFNQDIYNQYKGVYGYVGTAGSTPFQSTVVAATDARKVLNQQKAPRNDRRFVMDYTTEANALALAQFSDFDKVGDDDVKINGNLGRKFGFDFYSDDDVPTHTTGTWTSVVTAAAVAAGATSLRAQSTGAASEFKVGDIFTIAGDTQTYVVTGSATLSAGAAGSATISFLPALVVSCGAAAIMTVKATHVVNLAFQRDAFAFAQRPLQDMEGFELGNRIESMQDPVSGMMLRLEVSRQHKQTAFSVDSLYGTKLVRRELACRVAA